MLDGNCWALRHGQPFPPVSRKQNLVYVHTEMLSCPGRAATSMSLSSISSRVKLTSQVHHPLFVLWTCASCILMAASVVYKGFCEYDNQGFLNRSATQTEDGKPVLTSMMAGDKNCNFTLCKMSRFGTFHKVVHDVSSFSKQKTKQTVESAQYGLEINFKATIYIFFQLNC